MFAFECDRSLALPREQHVSLAPIEDPDLGLLRRTNSNGEAACIVNVGGNDCNLTINDYLSPTASVLALAKRVLRWLPPALPQIYADCASRVLEWIEDDEDRFPQYKTISHVAPTITLFAVDIWNQRCQLHLSTEVDTDHGIGIDLEIDDDRIDGSNVYIYG